MSDPDLSVVVVYVYPIMGNDHDTYAQRFADSYRRFRPSVPHQFVVISNGGDPTPIMRATFADLDPTWITHDDSGWDIGAYRKAAREIPCDLIVFFGGSSHVRGLGWLDRMIAAFLEHGEAIYGSMGSLGHNVHLRTTGFWLPPDLLNRYPYEITSDRTSRYEFEHGRRGLTMWVLSQGLKAWVVTWKSSFQHWQWDDIPNGFHQGDQSALLAWDRLADPPYHVPIVAQTHTPPGATPEVFSELERLRVVQATSLALVYVVRASSDLELAHRFFSAYRKIRSGVAHDLIIAAVGFESEAATLIVRQTVWSDVVPQPRILALPDPGFRLGVFREACLRLTSKYVCLLGELSRPLTDGWLARMYSVATRSGVGIAGSSGAHQIDPHVRDNAFCMDRSLFLEITAAASISNASDLQASATKSLTRQVQARGLSARIVGRTEDRDISNARDGRTFWWGNQEGLLVADDQTDDYAKGGEDRKAFLRAAGWPTAAPALAPAILPTPTVLAPPAPPTAVPPRIGTSFLVPPTRPVRATPPAAPPPSGGRLRARGRGA